VAKVLVGNMPHKFNCDDSLIELEQPTINVFRLLGHDSIINNKKPE